MIKTHLPNACLTICMPSQVINDLLQPGQVNLKLLEVGNKGLVRFILTVFKCAL